jgi:hypothetical protein
LSLLFGGNHRNSGNEKAKSPTRNTGAWGTLASFQPTEFQQWYRPAVRCRKEKEQEPGPPVQASYKGEPHAITTWGCKSGIVILDATVDGRLH